MMVNWGLSETLCYLRHLERWARRPRVEDAEPALWAAASRRRRSRVGGARRSETGAPARVQGCAARSAARIARVAGELFSV